MQTYPPRSYTRLHNAIQHDTTIYIEHTTQNYSIQQKTVQHYTTLFNTALYNTIQHDYVLQTQYNPKH